MEKIKTIAKYTTNIMGMITMLLVGLNAIDGITIPYTHQIVEVIAVLQGVIGAYLVSGKLFSKDENEQIDIGVEE